MADIYIHFYLEHTGTHVRATIILCNMLSLVSWTLRGKRPSCNDPFAAVHIY